MEEKKVVGDGKKFCGKINEILWGEVRGLRGKVGWGRGQETVEEDETNTAIRSTRDHRGPKNNYLWIFFLTKIQMLGLLLL